jgi:hypothetical protein
MQLPSEMLGRRYEFVQPLAGPDFVVVSYETVKRDCYVHTRDGDRVHLDLRLVLRCLRQGTIQESLKPAFTLDGPRRYIDRGRQAIIAEGGVRGKR